METKQKEIPQSLWQASKVGLHFLTITLPILTAVFAFMQIVLHYNTGLTNKFNDLDAKIETVKNEQALKDTVSVLRMEVIKQTIADHTTMLASHDSQIKVLMQKRNYYGR